MSFARDIQTVGRRRMVVRTEDGHVKIDIFLGTTQRLATLELELQDARALELAVGDAVNHAIWVMSEEQKDGAG